MTLSLTDLQRLSGTTGFRADTLEKVLLLLGLLDAIRAHPYAGPRVALKGGTALNLFALDVPRLSVDIDLNYVGAVGLPEMEAERPLVEQGLQAACERTGMTVKRIPTEHAGGKWRLSFIAAAGGTGTLELDVNYMLRSPLWPTEIRSPSALSGVPTPGKFPILDPHELAAGKLAALLARGASRDLFDARELLRPGSLDAETLRVAFVVYGALNRVDWRTVGLEAVTASAADVAERLLPMLRSDLVPAKPDIGTWTSSLVADCQRLLRVVLPLRENERTFLDGVNDRGEILPALLTNDERLRNVIAAHPALAWKALNVRKHRGLPG
ncbi:MAG: nucleotidyl transferase AbiEii/AbiGii toxin family protein [Acidobacteriota bacterium]